MQISLAKRPLFLQGQAWRHALTLLARVWPECDAVTLGSRKQSCGLLQRFELRSRLIQVLFVVINSSFWMLLVTVQQIT